MTTTDFHEIVQNYYGKQLINSADLQTSCCTAESPHPEHAVVIATLPDEIRTRFYGCGSPIPEQLEGLTAPDLGCGTGRVTDLLDRQQYGPDTHFYLCGLDAMIDEVTTWLESHDVDPTRIHREVFSHAQD